ncbi:MAG: FAD-dependent oxidoreductase [Clostridia bacterium]
MECHDIDAVDVLVCGAGSAGFCAAVQAARAGMKTALVERYGMPGGIMTVMEITMLRRFAYKRSDSARMGVCGRPRSDLPTFRT